MTGLALEAEEATAAMALDELPRPTIAPALISRRQLTALLRHQPARLLLICDGWVCDLTTLKTRHPGGLLPLLAYRGRDATDVVRVFHAGGQSTSSSSAVDGKEETAVQALVRRWLRASRVGASSSHTSVLSSPSFIHTCC